MFNGKMVRPDASWTVTGISDFSGDGAADVLWRNSSGELTEWAMNGPAITASSDLTCNGSVVRPDASWSVAGIGDFNGDGNKDILWRNTSGELVDWTMTGSIISASSDITFNGKVLPPPDASWSVAGIGDFNGDGKADILWRSSSGQLGVWDMNGSVLNASSALTFQNAPITPDASWHIIEIGDFNGDGNSDIMWRNDSGAMAEWLMNGSQIVASVTPSSNGLNPKPDASWASQANPTNFA
jgi:serralysin